jgi:DNA polymerase IV
MARPIIFHIDMDAFFASIEQHENPDLQDQCVVVGGASPRGVVAAASYNARQYGIHSAMPIFQARQKCPHLVIVPPRHKHYSQISRQIMSILENFSPLVEPVSIDEAFVDMSGCGRLYGSYREMAVAIKQQIQKGVELTCSVGVAPSKFLAKIASDMNKPDGITIVAAEQVPSFIDTLAIGKVPGVGARGLAMLAGLGIYTLGQVNHFDPGHLVRKLGKFGHHLIALAQGRDNSPVTPQRGAKSVSSEITLAADTCDRTELAACLLAQSQTIARQLRRLRVRARTVTLKIKTADFQQHTRSQTLDMPFHDSEAIYQAARSLLAHFALTRKVRLVGVGASGLQPATRPVQADLFPDDAKVQSGKWEKVDQAVDAAATRFGEQVVQRGTLTGQEKKRQ